MRGLVLIGIAAALCAASAPADAPMDAQAQAKLDKMLEGRVAGEARHCLTPDHVLHPIAIDSNTLVFRDGPRIWLNHLRGSFECEQLGKDSSVAFESGANLVCTGSTLYFSSGSLQGACALGEFIPYTKH